MEKLTKQIKPYLTFCGWIFTLLSILWMGFTLYADFKEDMRVVQKSTLRNTIWNESIPLHDRLESCDSYLELGYNSETKKLCEKLLDEDEYLQRSV